MGLLKTDVKKPPLRLGGSGATQVSPLRPVPGREAGAVHPHLPERQRHPRLADDHRAAREARLLARRGVRAGLEHRGRDEPVPGGHGAGLPAPVRDALQPQGEGRRGGDQLGRARRSATAGSSSKLRAAEARRRRAVRREGRGDRRRPGRPVVRLPARAARLRGDGVREPPPCRRHAALRHPAVPPAAAGARRRDPEDPRPRRRASAAASRSARTCRSRTCAATTQAIFVAIGAHQGKKLGVPGEDGPGVWTGTEFLNHVNAGKRVEIGGNVVVIGGGDTAIDAARVSKRVTMDAASMSRRLGAEVTILYRRTRTEMPAIEREIDEALEEGDQDRVPRGAERDPARRGRRGARDGRAAHEARRARRLRPPRPGADRGRHLRAADRDDHHRGQPGARHGGARRR